ncbi:MAG TPA: EAL domain-containing protein [Usitatibacter sp.]|nr:EAL domain-containing protein [Usitatibacter sp.]
MADNTSRLYSLSIRARIVLAVVLVAILTGGGMLTWAAHAQRKATIAQARDFAESVHQLALAGLTAMMITGTQEHRAVFLNQIEQANSVHSLRVLRGPAVISQYGPGTQLEAAVDELEKRVIAQGEPVFEVRGEGDNEVLKAVIPAVASHNFLGKDCLGCHRVAEGTVLGATTVEVSLQRAHAVVREFGQAMAAVAILLLVPLAVLTWVAVHGWLTVPLEKLSRRLDDIARGDANLAHRLDTQSGDEIAQASAAFNRVLEKASQMRQSERIASDVFDHALEGILVADKDARIVKVNPAFTRTTGYSAEEALGMNPRMLQSGQHGAEFYKEFWTALRTRGEWQGDIWNKRKNGEIYPEWLNITAVRDGRGEVEHYVAIFSDITERKQQEAIITYQAYHDALTGLPNRVLFRDRVEQALAIARRHEDPHVAVMFLDLDRFKFINDSLGHKVGDLLLKEVARRLKESVRESDTVARLGGDEFTVLLPEIAGIGGVESVAQKILEATRQPYRLGDKDLNVTTSIGIAMFPQDGKDVDTLMKNADTAMYHVKGQGRAGYRVYDAELSARMRRHLELESELRKALAGSQLKVLYQPQMSLETGMPIAVEALLRWRHPRLGLIEPGEFLDLAEQTGEIVPIGRFVLETACRDAAGWQGAPPLGVTVNLSTRQFQHDGLLRDVSHALAMSGLAPERLELEIAEGLAMRDVERTIERLRELSRLGVRLAISEFGMGFHSSISDLRRMPVNAVKIDRALVRDLDRSPDNVSVMAGVIGMARGPRVSVVAVGVESRDQLQHLHRLKCDNAQGRYFSEPVTAREIAAMKVVAAQASLAY